MHEFSRNSGEIVPIDTFVQYTHPFCDDVHENLFPTNFDLSFLSSSIDDIYSYIPQNCDTKKMIRTGESKESDVERGGIIYLDQTDGTVKMTDIASGEYDSVALNFTPYAQKGGLPLMEIHTHPVDALFSPEDYVSMCLSNGKMRRTKASLILCPSIQVLAFATQNSPKLTPSQSDKFILDWNTIFNQLQNDINTKELSIRNHLRKIGWNEALIYNTRDNEYLANLHHLSNQFHIELSRSLNLKIYTSNNRHDFYASN